MPIPEGVRAYLDFPGHDLYRHYEDLPECKQAGLVFTPAFRAARLPPSGGDHFDAEILDTSDGKAYRVKMYVAYDEGRRGTLDADFNWVDGLDSLQSHFYGCHCCPCHMKHYAASAGAETDDECEGDRFVFRSITYEGLPGLILYSETMTAEELEKTLATDGPDKGA